MNIALSNTDKVAVINAGDAKKVGGLTWWISNGYAMSGYYIGNRRTGRKWMGVRMNRLIMDAPNGVFVDHKDQDKLNNRRRNLRFSTNKQNCRNMRQNARKKKPTTSRFKGVTWDRARGRWSARIMVNYRGVFLGRYEDEIFAALAYNEAAVKYFGDFASLNKIEKKERRILNGKPRRPFDRRKSYRALSIEQMLAARRMKTEGMSYPEIAARLGLKKSSDQSVRQAVIRPDYYSPAELEEAKKRGLI